MYIINDISYDHFCGHLELQILKIEILRPYCTSMGYKQSLKLT